MEGGTIMKNCKFLFLVSFLLLILYFPVSAVQAETTYTWKRTYSPATGTQENGCQIMHNNINSSHADGETNYADVYVSLEIPPESFPANQELSLKFRLYGDVRRNDRGRGIYESCDIIVAEPGLSREETQNAGYSMTPDDYTALSWGNYTTGGFSDRETVVSRYMSSSGYNEGDEISIYLRTSFDQCEWRYRLEKHESNEETTTNTADTEYVLKGDLVYAVRGGKAAFFYRKNEKLTKITIPAAIKHNGKTIPVTSVYAEAFKDMKSLKTVVIGKNVSVIGKNAFLNCTNLKTVTGGKALATIGEAAFSGCRSLDKITLYAKVKSIGKNAFLNCAKLKLITIQTAKLTAAKVGKNAFSGIYKKAVFKVPKKKLTAYTKFLKKKGIGKKVKITK